MDPKPPDPTPRQPIEPSAGPSHRYDAPHPLPPKPLFLRTDESPPDQRSR